ncbi:MAG: hypothetical protein K2R98_00840, partial [Gemmataceae bacterium]|nr:hypothetical protein [Gemmataceae bacterium]
AGLGWQFRVWAHRPQRIGEAALLAWINGGISLKPMRRGWALWAGVLVVPLLAVYATGMVFGMVDTGGYFSERDPAMQLTLEAVALTLLTLQFIAYLLGLNAWYANYRPGESGPLPSVLALPPNAEQPRRAAPTPTAGRQ